MAKNAGKTEALTATIRGRGTAGRRLAVTSIGRDGEHRDVLDRRIPKPDIELPAGSLVATTAALLRASSARCRQLEPTSFRTPLGNVVIAEMLERGAVQVAGPGTAADTRAVVAMMLARGAEQVFIDGAIDRRSAASPDIADGIVLSTGAVVHEDVDEVVRLTQSAVELMRLPAVEDERLARLASRTDADLVVDETYGAVELAPLFALRASRADVTTLLDTARGTRALIVRGALCASFLEHLLAARRANPITIVVGDATKVFLESHGCSWFRTQGIDIRSLRPVNLLAVSVNPVAQWPRPVVVRELRERLQIALADIPVIDVRDPDPISGSRREPGAARARGISDRRTEPPPGTLDKGARTDDAGVEVRPGADGRGDGVFATRAFAIGETVIPAAPGRIVENGTHPMQISLTEWRDEEGLGQIVNHSCDPNCGVRIDEQIDGFDYVARRPIAVGEEVTFDYAMRCYVLEYFPAACVCDSDRCRGSVTGWKDLPPERKAAYGPLVAPYLRQVDRDRGTRPRKRGRTGS